MGYNIGEVTGSTGASGGVDDWTFDVDLSDPSVTVVTGDFNQVALDGTDQGEAAAGYSFSGLSSNAWGSLSYNTADGTFTFTIDRAAILASGSDQTVTFTVTGSDGLFFDTDTVILNLLICVARGTMIRCKGGQRPVEDIRPGDAVWTLDDGLQTVRWVGSRRLSGAELRAEPSLRPIRIRPGALGEGRPRRTLRVSPQHRLLLSDWRAEMLFGAPEVLAPAKGLVDDGAIMVDHAATEVEYFHLLFDRHQIIETEGALTESFHPGPWSLREIDRAAREELFRLFPELEADLEAYGEAARMALKPFEARLVGRLPADTPPRMVAA